MNHYQQSIGTTKDVWWVKRVEFEARTKRNTPCCTYLCVCKGKRTKNTHLSVYYLPTEHCKSQEKTIEVRGESRMIRCKRWQILLTKMVHWKANLCVFLLSLSTCVPNEARVKEEELRSLSAHRASTSVLCYTYLQHRIVYKSNDQLNLCVNICLMS